MSDLIRVSCASLCRIEHHGRYLLLINANRRRKGKYILSPIGGALTLLDPTILATFDAHLDEDNGQDLRLSLPQVRLPDFRTWFYSGQGRERSPFRELHEELVTESGLLSALDEQDVTWTYLGTVEDTASTEREGYTGMLTHYFFEIYDITFARDSILGPLLVLPKGSGAAWVSADQLRQGGTLPLDVDGEVRDAVINGHLLLRPSLPGSTP